MKTHTKIGLNMGRPGITITNRDRNRKTHDDKWFFNVDKVWKTFDKDNYLDGIAWVSSQLKRGER